MVNFEKDVVFFYLLLKNNFAKPIFNVNSCAYKGQGRNQSGVMTPASWEFLVQGK